MSSQNPPSRRDFRPGDLVRFPEELWNADITADKKFVYVFRLSFLNGRPALGDVELVPAASRGILVSQVKEYGDPYAASGAWTKLSLDTAWVVWIADKKYIVPERKMCHANEERNGQVQTQDE